MLVFRNREDIKVNKKTKLNFIELDDFSAVVTAGGWKPGEIAVGEDQRRYLLSMGTTYVQCLLVVARKLAYPKRITIV